MPGRVWQRVEIPTTELDGPMDYPIWHLLSSYDIPSGGWFAQRCCPWARRRWGQWLWEEPPFLDGGWIWTEQL